MGLVSRIKAFLGKPWVTLTHGGVQRRQDPASDLFHSYSEQERYEVLRFQSVVSSCVRLLVSTLSYPPLKVGLRMNGRFDPIQDADEARLLNLNPDYTRADLLSLWVGSYYIAGAGYLYKMRGPGRRIRRLVYLPATHVIPVANTESYSPLFAGYRVGMPSSFTFVPPEDMIVLRNPDPGNPWTDLPLTDAAARDIQFDDDRQAYFAELLQYMPVPSMIFSPDRPIAAPTQKQILQDAQNALGAGRRGGAMFAPPGTKVEIQNPGVQDYAWPQYTAINEARICAVFGVPPQLVGVKSGLDAGTYTNYDKTKQAFYEVTMTPLWRKVEHALTRGLFLDERQPGPEFAFDLTEVPELTARRETLVAQIVSLHGAGIIDTLEARELLDLKLETPNGNLGRGDDGPGRDDPGGNDPGPGPGDDAPEPGRE